MTAREILAYAITHAPKGVKGGPYDSAGGRCRDLAMALRWTKRGARARLGDVLGGRVIRIVRKAQPSEASAVEVLREARDVLALCTTGRHVRTAPEYAIVKRIGSEMGYGALMSAATAAWAEMFDGTPQAGAQHTSGPAECTVQRTLAAIDRVLAGV